MPDRARRLLSGLVATLVLACGGSKPSTTPSPVSRPPQEPIKPFAAAVFTGQPIALLPLTLVVSADSLGHVAALADRARTLAWADSLVGEAFVARGPEVKWVLPAELRRIARRSPTVAPDPDRMGQAILRAKLEDVPDPLRGQLRSLMALVGGRYAMAPAALQFVTEGSGRVRAELALALADTRTGKVLWRTVAWGEGAEPISALGAAMDNVLPVRLDIQ